MAWNGSEKKLVKAENVGKRTGRVNASTLSYRFNYKILFVALLFILVIGLTIWMVLGRARDPEIIQESRSKSSRIREVIPTAAQTNRETKIHTQESRKEKPYWERENTNGFNEAMIRKWKFMRQPKPSFTNDMAKNRPRLKCEIFDTPVENEIATLMTIKPGTTIIGIPNYDESYDREFMKSCESPIIITKDDDEYTQQLKKDMIQMKIELRDRMSKGEKLCDILRETRLEALRLSQIKADVLESLWQSLKEADSKGESDEIYYEAANKLLEKQGVAPIKRLGINKHWINQRKNSQQP